LPRQEPQHDWPTAQVGAEWRGSRRFCRRHHAPCGHPARRWDWQQTGARLTTSWRPRSCRS